MIDNMGRSKKDIYVVKEDPFQNTGIDVGDLSKSLHGVWHISRCKSLRGDSYI